MSKRKGIIGLFVLFMAVFIYLLDKVYNKLDYREKVYKNILYLKEHNYLGINGNLHKTAFSTFPTIIIFFNTECQHCQAEAKLMAQNQEKFNNAVVYFSNRKAHFAKKHFFV